VVDALDMMRQDALSRRVKGIAGGNRILWSAKDIATIHDYVMAMPETIIRAAPTTVVHKSPEIDLASIRRKLLESGVAVNRDMQSDDLSFLYIISSQRVDLSNDDIDQAGIDFEDYKKNNPVILDSHDSSVPPIAVSSPPWLSGGKTMAIAKFPRPGISADSDRVAAAIRGGLIRGASIGFVPLRWSFTKDPTRPLGISFSSVKMIEFSTCSIPCNSDCLLVGPVSGGKSAPDVKMADLRREARALAAKARALGESIPADRAPTRESIPTDPIQARAYRIAEARRFRRDADLAGRS
jgi:hypothetical protein